MMFSIIETAKANGLNPVKYVERLLKKSSGAMQMIYWGISCLEW
jgi:hypothetical protein